MAPVATMASGVMSQHRDRLPTTERQPVENAGRGSGDAPEVPCREHETDQPGRRVKADRRRSWLILQDARLGADGGPLGALDLGSGCGEGDKPVLHSRGDGGCEPGKETCR